MSKRSHASLYALIFSLILAGCASAPAPNPDGPVLLGFDSLPKALATVQLSPTPDESAMQATLALRFPTPTLAPATRTPSPTPYVGIFMGDLTPLPGTVAFQPQGTRSPLIITVEGLSGPPAGGGIPAVPPTGAPNPGAAAGTCAVEPAPQFAGASANPSIRQRLGCPNAAPFGIQLVTQPFQNGYMFWRDTREVYVLSMVAIQRGQSSFDTFWRFPDAWNESLPASDPSLIPPEGLHQPVRGFGFVWRSNPAVRDVLGWALAPEQVYQATWQQFERGWMMTGIDGAVFALSPNDDSPTAIGMHFGRLSP